MRKILFIKLLIIMFASSVSAQQPETATVLLNNAYKQAKKENKHVFVMFHASWCGWCKKMEAYMESPALKPLFDKNYIFVPLTVNESPKNKQLENPGAIDILKKYKAEKTGIPFFLIFDANGKLIEDAFDANGQNIGCPSTKEEVAEFTTMLRNTSKLTNKELAMIANTFTIKK